jgi:hypothetical protein
MCPESIQCAEVQAVSSESREPLHRGLWMIEKISQRNFSLFMLGQAFIALSFGAVYSLKFVRTGGSFAAFIAATLLSSFYITTSILHYQRSQQIMPKKHAIGFTGGFLLLLFLGVQSPHLPLKRYILFAGLILIIPALSDLAKHQKEGYKHKRGK